MWEMQWQINVQEFSKRSILGPWRIESFRPWKWVNPSKVGNIQEITINLHIQEILSTKGLKWDRYKGLFLLILKKRGMFKYSMFLERTPKTCESNANENVEKGVQNGPFRHNRALGLILALIWGQNRSWCMSKVKTLLESRKAIALGK